MGRGTLLILGVYLAGLRHTMAIGQQGSDGHAPGAMRRAPMRLWMAIAGFLVGAAAIAAAGPLLARSGELLHGPADERYTLAA